MIELDVLSEHPDGSGRLLVAHDYEDMRSRPPLSFEQALEHLSDERFAGVELDVDIKLPGYELRVLEALRELELVERTLVSGMFPDGLAQIRAAEPGAAPRLVGAARAPRLHDRRAHRDPGAGDADRLPRDAAPAGPRGAPGRRFDAIMAHWRVVTPALVRAVRRRRRRAVRVDRRRRAHDREARPRMGVDGIITNDPRLFSRSTQVGGAEARRGRRRRGSCAPAVVGREPSSTPSCRGATGSSRRRAA